MPKLPRWTGSVAERALMAVGLEHLRSKSSPRLHAASPSFTTLASYFARPTGLSHRATNDRSRWQFDLDLPYG